jgi:hypothetical protein
VLHALIIAGGNGVFKRSHFFKAPSFRPAWRTKVMAIEVNITPEQINEAVGQAIVDSAIGQSMKKLLEEKVKELGNPYSGLLPKVLEQEVALVLREMIREEPYATMIREKVKEKLTDEIVYKVTNAAYDSFFEKL